MPSSTFIKEATVFKITLKNAKMFGQKTPPTFFRDRLGLDLLLPARGALRRRPDLVVRARHPVRPDPGKARTSSELGLPGVRVVVWATGLERRLLVVEVRLEIRRPTFVLVRLRRGWPDAFRLVAGERILWTKKWGLVQV